MNLTESIAPRSDQWNADDLVGGPVTVTVRDVVKGKAEQPFDFLLVESDRAFRPGVNMRRLIVKGWGPETQAYAGRRLTLYRDPSIKFGSATVGGIRISHMSNIAEPVEERFQTTRGKRELFTVQPLPDAPAPSATTESGALLADVMAAAAKANVPLPTIAADWAESHDGQQIKDATDLGSLELLRDDLNARAETTGAQA